MSSPVVRVSDVSKSYRLGAAVIAALREVSLEVEPAAMVALAGPSGSGKSTLLNLIGCLDRPESGEILLDGRCVSHLPAAALNAIRRDRLGFVFQSFNLVPGGGQVHCPLHGRRRAHRRSDRG